MSSVGFYDMKQLAEIFPVGRNNLYNMVHQEGFPKLYVGKKILIPKMELEEWIRKSACS